MSDTQGEVKVKLVFDSNAKEAADAAKHEVDGLDKDAKAKGNIFSRMLGGDGFSVIKGAMANLVSGLVTQMGHLGKEAITAPFEAFTESEEQVRSLTGTLSMFVDQATGLDEVRDGAAGIKDELEMMAMQAGVTDDEMVALFQNLIEHGTKTIEQAEALADEMAYAGRAIPGGAQALSTGFEQIEMGIIRAKNPLVQFISATGLLHGNAKAVAKEMSKMSVAKQMELAEKAVSKMADRMKEQPMTIAQMITSLKVFGGNLLEGAGEPMVKSATNVMAKIQKAFFNEKGGLSPFAESLMKKATEFGDMVGKAFDLGMDFVDGFGEGISEFSEEFGFIWKEVFGDGEASFTSWKGIAKDIGHVLGEGVKAVGVGLGVIVLGVEKAVKYLTLAAAKLVQAWGTTTGDNKAVDMGNQMAYKALSPEQGELLGKARATQGGDETKIRADYMDNAKAFGADMAHAARDLDIAFAERRRVQKDVDIANQAMMVGDLTQFTAAFNDAAKAHDQGAMNQVAAIMRGSNSIKDAMMNLGPKVLGEGAQAFIDALNNVGETGLADKLKSGMADGSKALQIKPDKMNVTQNFSGGISIKQDFKDQDPDRILVAFRDSLASAASSRLQARTALPFGR